MVKQHPNSLEEARKCKNAYVILEGDDGGWNYVVAPMTMVNCSEQALKDLLRTIDPTDAAHVYYVEAALGEIVVSRVSEQPTIFATEDVWIKPDLPANLYNLVRRVLAGK